MEDQKEAQSDNHDAEPEAEAAPVAAALVPAIAGAPAIAPEIPRIGVPTGAGRPIPAEGSPNYLLLAVVSIVTLGVDIASKNWAEKALEAYPGTIALWDNHAALILAKNRGGAWGFFQTANESIRRPFFLLVSAAAIIFIVTLFRRLQPRQHALRWGLPLVMGGALGNVFDRIRYGYVIDFIDLHTIYKGVDHHWPTFNVADIAICVGVGLMAVDMFTSRRGPAPITPVPAPAPQEPAAAPEVSSETNAEPEQEARAAEEA